MTADERVQEGVAHLQGAAMELISAARAFLDVAEELVKDPAPLAGAVAALGDLLGPLAAKGRSAAAAAAASPPGTPAPAEGAEAKQDGSAGGDDLPPRSPRVQHIRVS